MLRISTAFNKFCYRQNKKNNNININNLLNTVQVKKPFYKKKQNWILYFIRSITDNLINKISQVNNTHYQTKHFTLYI